MALLSLRETLDSVRHVDHHAHVPILGVPASLDRFRGLFSLSRDPRQWPHVAASVTYQRAIGVLAAQLGCDADEAAVYERRRVTDPDVYAGELMAAAGAETMLIDEGYPPPGVGVTLVELAQLARCPVLPVLRIERLVEDGRADTDGAVRDAVGAARQNGFAALKTVVAYRGGLVIEALAAPTRSLLFAALEANEATGDPLPVQVHSGLGDADLVLPNARPGHLGPLVERFGATQFVLLHCYPFVREAGWMASVYANVHMDLSLTIPHVSRPAAVLREALELAPTSKVLYASDGIGTPELYLLAAVWWRDALAAVLSELLAPQAAEDAARTILRGNARALYRL